MSGLTHNGYPTNKELEAWASEWVCKCGKQFRKTACAWAFYSGSSDTSSRFMTFGKCTLCPECGGNLGKDGPCDQVKYQVGRFHIIRNKRAIYRWWKPWTWPKYRIKYEHEIRGKKGEKVL